MDENRNSQQHKGVNSQRYNNVVHRKNNNAARYNNTQQYKANNSQRYKSDNANQHKPNSTQHYKTTGAKQYGPNSTKQYGPNSTKQYGPNSTKQYGPNSTKQYGQNGTKQYRQNSSKQYKLDGTQTQKNDNMQSNKVNNTTQQNKRKNSNKRLAEKQRREMELRRKKVQKRRIGALIVIGLLLIFSIRMVVSMVSGKPEKSAGDNGNNISVSAGDNKTGDNKSNDGKEEETTKKIKKKKYVVKRPVLRESEEEIYSELKKLKSKNSDLKEIYKNRTEYPKDLLAALVNNLEMTEFAKGYLTASGKTNGGLTEKEKNEDYPLFIQWDKRWGYVSYGDSDIGLAGCGPTCLAMVAYSFTRDEKITPAKVAKYSMQKGYYVEGAGTAWSLMSSGARDFGLYSEEILLSEESMKQSLDNGEMLICSMRAGDFTTLGHFIVIYGYDEDGFYVNDPNCIYRSGKKWSYEKLSWQINNIWAFSEMYE